MKNRLIIMSVLIGCILMAAPVDLNKAQRVAGNIYLERSNIGTMDGLLIFNQSDNTAHNSWCYGI